MKRVVYWVYKLGGKSWAKNLLINGSLHLFPRTPCFFFFRHNHPKFEFSHLTCLHSWLFIIIRNDLLATSKFDRRQILLLNLNRIYYLLNLNRKLKGLKPKFEFSHLTCLHSWLFTIIRILHREFFSPAPWQKVTNTLWHWNFRFNFNTPRVASVLAPLWYRF